MKKTTRPTPKPTRKDDPRDVGPIERCTVSCWVCSGTGKVHYTDLRGACECPNCKGSGYHFYWIL